MLSLKLPLRESNDDLWRMGLWRRFHCWNYSEGLYYKGETMGGIILVEREREVKCCMFKDISSADSSVQSEQYECRLPVLKH